jgi:hypothetical protein
MPVLGLLRIAPPRLFNYCIIKKFVLKIKTILEYKNYFREMFDGFQPSRFEK